MSLSSHPVTGDAIRSAMRRVPSAVTVVTVGGAEPRGITIGSFVTVSLEPPLVCFNVQRASRMHDLLSEAGLFAVHVLSEDQEAVSEIFADPDLSDQDQLFRAGARLDEHGLPDLPECLIRFECVLEDRFDAGDHSIFLGLVERMSHRSHGNALLYFNQGYWSLAD